MAGFFAPRATYDIPWSGRLLVLAPPDLPTTHYYLDARLAALPPERVLRVNALSADAAAQIALAPPGSFAVIVRNISLPALRALVSCRDRLAGAAFLVDDDLPNAWRCRELPLAYGLRTSWRYFRRVALLARVCDQLWVSTMPLAERRPPDAAGRVRMLPPRWYGAVPEVAAPGNRQWFYHATAAHRAEAEWLVPVVARVQARCPDAVFEIVGGPKVERYYRGIPRVRVLPQMPWSAYCRESTTRRMAVGLAPLLDTAFNRCRAPVKLFDIARLGAVGVFSDMPTYRGAVVSGESGLLVRMDIGAWADAVEQLLQDDGMRMRMFSAASRALVEPSDAGRNCAILGNVGGGYAFSEIFTFTDLR